MPVGIGDYVTFLADGAMRWGIVTSLPIFGRITVIVSEDSTKYRIRHSAIVGVKHAI